MAGRCVQARATLPGECPAPGVLEAASPRCPSDLPSAPAGHRWCPGGVGGASAPATRLMPPSPARLEVHLVGGFSDDRQLSQKLTHQLLSKSAVPSRSGLQQKPSQCQAYQGLRVVGRRGGGGRHPSLRDARGAGTWLEVAQHRPDVMRPPAGSGGRHSPHPSASGLYSGLSTPGEPRYKHTAIAGPFRNRECPRLCVQVPLLVVLTRQRAGAQTPHSSHEQGLVFRRNLSVPRGLLLAVPGGEPRAGSMHLGACPAALAPRMCEQRPCSGLSRGRDSSCVSAPECLVQVGGSAGQWNGA